MRVVKVSNLNRSDVQYVIITDWLNNNIDCLSFLEVGDDQEDQLHGSIYYQFDNVADATAFIGFLYCSFADLVLFVSINEQKVALAHKNTKSNDPRSFHLYDAMICYAKTKMGSCAQIMSTLAK